MCSDAQLTDRTDVRISTTKYRQRVALLVPYQLVNVNVVWTHICHSFFLRHFFFLFVVFVCFSSSFGFCRLCDLCFLNQLSLGGLAVYIVGSRLEARRIFLWLTETNVAVRNEYINKIGWNINFSCENIIEIGIKVLKVEKTESNKCFVGYSLHLLDGKIIDAKHTYKNQINKKKKIGERSNRSVFVANADYDMVETGFARIKIFIIKIYIDPILCCLEIFPYISSSSHNILFVVLFVWRSV